MVSNSKKLIVLDVDGVLTNGMYYISSDGRVTKGFYTRDFWAIEKATTSGFDVVILTSSFEGCINKKVAALDNDKVKVESCVSDKLIWMENVIIPEREITWDDVIYIGDAENDIDCMELAKITACPNDAIPAVKELSHYIAGAKGGDGAVYEIITKILNGDFDYYFEGNKNVN